MGKLLACNFPLTRTRPRRTSTASVSVLGKKLQCSECSKDFSRKGDLKRHELLHTGVKNHECPQCQKRFSQNSGLKTHMNVHTGHKPYRCAYVGCGAEFGDPSSHARHKKETHLVDYRYECPFERCDSAIKRRSAFAQHLTKKHNKSSSSDELDAMKKPFLSPTQRRKSGNDLTRTTASHPVRFYHADTGDHNLISLHTDIEQSNITDNILPLSLPSFENCTEAECFHPELPQQRSAESFFLPPTWSSSTVSSLSTQSSTETLADDLVKFDDFTDTKLFYNVMTDPLRPITGMVASPNSSSSSSTGSPFVEGEFQYPATPLSSQDLQKMNSQLAYDRHQYTQNIMVGNQSHLPYWYDQNAYPFPQDKDIHYSPPHMNPIYQSTQHQHSAQQWGSWEFA